jgi:hypothetical protein
VMVGIIYLKILIHTIPVENGDSLPDSHSILNGVKI